MVPPNLRCRKKQRRFPAVNAGDTTRSTRAAQGRPAGLCRGTPFQPEHPRGALSVFAAGETGFFPVSACLSYQIQYRPAAAVCQAFFAFPGRAKRQTAGLRRAVFPKGPPGKRIAAFSGTFGLLPPALQSMAGWKFLFLENIKVFAKPFVIGLPIRIDFPFLGMIHSVCKQSIGFVR